MTEDARGRGRPTTGRNVVAQVGLDQKSFELVVKIASTKRKSVSEVLRELVLEGLSGRSRQK